MKYLTSSTTSLSMVLAVVLFAVASWVDSKRPAPEPPEESTSPQLMGAVREDSAIRDESVTRDCRAAERRLFDTLDASQSCSVDADCVLFDYGYPIQCLTSVAREDISALRTEYKNYEDACTYRVYYDCPTEPVEREPVCRQNRCTVELRTLDMLKDQTLEHLGIEPAPGRADPER